MRYYSGYFVLYVELKLIERDIIKELEKWKKNDNRKPLILRGARQVGKTTAVDIFSKQFEQYIYLNLDKNEDKKIFEKDIPFKDLVDSIFFMKNKHKKAKTLIFIDEIQNSSKAISLLRYFYEDVPEYFVIAAGSLLETIMDNKINFPVGRCEYKLLRPLSFQEYLNGIGEYKALGLIDTIPIPEYAHDKLLKLFNRYSLIGGMPEVISRYIETDDLKEVESVYESLIVSYLDDVEKYTKTNNMAYVIRHCIKNSFKEAGTRIKFEKFGESSYKSKEVGESLRILEKALLVNLVYPTTEISIPITPNTRRSPRLYFLDTGLVNYFSGIMGSLLTIEDLNSQYNGRIAEHIVGQEILSNSYSPLKSLNFWTREKKQSNAEVDYIIQHKNLIIPIEVKSGKSGTLRSLHQFINIAPHNFAVRLYAGNFLIEKNKTPEGKEYTLLSAPYYLASNIERYIEYYFKEE